MTEEEGVSNSLAEGKVVLRTRDDHHLLKKTSVLFF